MAATRDCIRSASASRKNRESPHRSNLSADRMRDEIWSHFVDDLTAALYVELPARSQSIKLPSDEQITEPHRTDDGVTDPAA